MEPQKTKAKATKMKVKATKPEVTNEVATTPRFQTVSLDVAKEAVASRKTRQLRLEYQDMLRNLPSGEAGVFDIAEFKDYVRERIRITNAAADLNLKVELKKVNQQLYFWVA